MLREGNLQSFLEHVQATPAWRWRGRVLEANGQVLESDGPPCSVGEICEVVTRDGARHEAEVVGFRGARLLLMPLVSPRGIAAGDAVYANGHSARTVVSEHMLGRVLDATGAPIDRKGPLLCPQSAATDADVPDAMERVPIKDPLATGIRAIDGMLSVGRGQRLGIFGGSGVGKSTLIGMMTRNTSADVIVLGLVGERGREVREFLDDALGEEGQRRSAVFVSTSDQSPLLRMRAAFAATAAAEFYARRGQQVLLVLDSLTRFAMAAREIGLVQAGTAPVVVEVERTQLAQADPAG